MSSEAVDIVIDTFEDEKEAAKHMHKCARNLRRRHLTNRYGVFKEQRRGAWWLMHHDRGTA